MIGSFATAASVVSIASKASKKRRAPPPPTMKNIPNSQENIVNISAANSEVGKSVPNVPNTLERCKYIIWN